MNDSQHERLDTALRGLNEWEQEIIVREAEDIAEGLRRGLPDYGHWDPSKDGRNHKVEAEQEDRDRRVYTQMDRIKCEMARES